MGIHGDLWNLDFENANLEGYSPGNIVPAVNAFPGWTVNAVYIPYDDFSLSGESISIMDANSPFFTTTIQGTYYALFEAGNSPSSSQTISLGQTGTIPMGTESITFWGAALAACKSRSMANRLHLARWAILPITTFMGRISRNSQEPADNCFLPCQPLPAAHRWITSSFQCCQFLNQARLRYVHSADCFLCGVTAIFLLQNLTFEN